MKTDEETRIAWNTARLFIVSLGVVLVTAILRCSASEDYRSDAMVRIEVAKCGAKGP
jgi:hypothetical protein